MPPHVLMPSGPSPHSTHTVCQSEHGSGLHWHLRVEAPGVLALTTCITSPPPTSGGIPGSGATPDGSPDPSALAQVQQEQTCAAKEPDATPRLTDACSQGLASVCGTGPPGRQGRWEVPGGDTCAASDQMPGARAVLGPPRNPVVSQGPDLAKPGGCTVIPSLLLRFTGSGEQAVSWDFWEKQLRHKHTREPQELSCLCKKTFILAPRVPF